MNISLAFVKNERQVLFHSFEKEGIKAQIFDLEDLSDHCPQAILISEELSQSSEVQDKLSSNTKYSPIKVIKDKTFDSDRFDNITLDEATKIIKETLETWSLKQNLNLIENMFEYIEQLESLFPNDRTAFFEELWHLIRINLAASNLTVVYNHMKKPEKSNDKNKLVRVVIEGQNKPNPTENQELGEALFKNYEGKFNQNFELYSKDEKGALVFLGKIKESPLIILAESFSCGPLQLASLGCLFKGLNRLS